MPYQNNSIKIKKLKPDGKVFLQPYRSVYNWHVHQLYDNHDEYSLYKYVQVVVLIVTNAEILVALVAAYVSPVQSVQLESTSAWILLVSGPEYQKQLFYAFTCRKTSAPLLLYVYPMQAHLSACKWNQLTLFLIVSCWPYATNDEV